MKLWSWLLAVESEGYLDSDPAKFMRTMNSRMLDDMHRLAPKIAAWFSRVGEIDAS
jgi:hypothetical protein